MTERGGGEVGMGAAQREFLKRWWAARLLDEAWGAVSTEAVVDVGVRPGLPWGEPFAAGQLRLIHPSRAPDQPRYFVLLPGVGAELVAVPFSRYVVPATPDEVLTGLEDPALAVLCIGNRRCAGAAGATWSCALGGVTPAWCSGIVECLEGWPGTADADPWRLRIGAPVLHPLDPRHDYMAAERAWWRRIWVGAEAYPEAGDGTAEWRLAADGRELYGGEVQS